MLVRVIFRKKSVFVVLFAILASLAFAYSFLQPPIFKSEVLFAQPEITQYSQLRQFSIATVQLAPRELFYEYKNNLSSQINQYKFLTEHSKQYFPDAISFTQHAVSSNDVGTNIGRFRSIERTWLIEHQNRATVLPFLPSNVVRFVVYAEIPERYFFNLSVEFHNSEIASNIANDYAKYVNQITIDTLTKRILYLIEERKTAIEKEISQKIYIAKQEKGNLIVQLEEQALIAETLRDRSPITSTAGRIELMPLYFRGADALRAQADILRARSNDIPFIHGLETLRTELSYINAPDDIIPSAQTAAHIALPAHATTNPINNSKVFLFVIALGLSLILGAIYNIFDYYLHH